MRHGKKINHLSRTAPHRKAMLSNMAASLILHKRITTTLAKAKALRKYVEPLITKAKDNTTHSRRVAFSYLQSKEATSELFGSVAEKVSTRPGGYTRIIRIGNRLGDNAETCMMELVDFNELLQKDSAPAKGKAKRTRRAGGAKAKATAEGGATEAKAEAKATKATEEKSAPAKAKPAKSEGEEDKNADA